MPRRLARIGLAGGLVLVALLGAELTARMDDLIRRDIPLLAAPNHDRDLTMRDRFGVHGRPFGRYQKWALNRFGFRSPDMTLQPPAGCTRVMVLGASEMFGYYESEGQEVAAQLTDSLREAGCFEVVNAAMVGFTEAAQTQLWNNWDVRFRPAVVMIYPSPAFYLADRPPDYPNVAGPQILADQRWWRPRLLERLHERIHYPQFIQRRRLERMIAAKLAGHDPDWRWTRAPTDRLALFRRHLDSLVASVKASGARMVLVTPTMRFAYPLRGDDDELMLDWRQFFPRPTPATLMEFVQASDSIVAGVAKARDAWLVDAASVTNGHRAWFADATHFTDGGAGVMAGLMAAGVLAEARRATPH